MDDIIQRIKQKLAYLQRHDDGDVTDAMHDRQWQIENTYPYKLQPPHTENEIAAFEAKHKIRLPKDYRLFLLHVGRSDVGPGYGIDSPITHMGTLEEIEAVNDEPSDDEVRMLDAMPLIRLDHPFPFTEATTDAFEFVSEQGLDDEDMYRGQISVAEFGSGVWQGLVITGPCRGEMWYTESNTFTPIFIMTERGFELNEEDRAHFTPETRATFTQWYEAWLNREIRVAQEHWQKRGRNVPPLILE